jgi:DNA-binding transcriptional LysR family regulator
MSLRLRQLRYFVVVAEEGQITRAAAKLHLAQPALSQAITQLESQLAVKLLERHPRGVSLTSAGESFFTKARAALDAVAEADLAARSLSRGRRGAVEFGFIGAPPMIDAPDLFTAFAALHPDIEVSFRELPFPSGSRAAWAEEVDLALCFALAPDDNVRTYTLREDARAIVAASTHPLAQRSERSVAEVLDETFVGFHPHVDRSWAGFWHLDDHRGEPCRRVTSDRAINPQEMAAIIASGRAIITAPVSNARNFTKALAGVSVIPLRDARPAELSLVWHRDAGNLLVAALVATARTLSERPPEQDRSVGA